MAARVGKAFAKGETVDRATTALARFAERIERGRDMVAIVLSRGARVLAHMPQHFLYVEPLRWPRSNRHIPVRVMAHVRPSENGPIGRVLQSGDPIDRRSGIQFQARSAYGPEFAKEQYKVWWQVVNTDRAAADDDGLRGEFYSSKPHGCRHEDTKYRGVHWVQAFLINKRTNHCDGESERFFVVIR